MTDGNARRVFATLGDHCVAVVVPANGYLSSTGNEWECNRGYLKAGLACGPVRLPANAHADDSSNGTGWQCDRGFRETNDRCEKVIVPADGYFVGLELRPRLGMRHAAFVSLARDARAWTFRRTHYLRDSGDEWECERGFARGANSLRAGGRARPMAI